MKFATLEYEYECLVICILEYVTLVTIISATAKNYPIYGTQWHPEKNAFEWTTKEGINHSEHAVMITQTAAKFFVTEDEYPTLLHTFTNVPQKMNICSL